MEEKAPVRSTMVSRLPKFGTRPSPGGTSPLPNGSSQPTTPTQEGKTTPPGTRPNGVVRGSSFSLKWRKDSGSTPTTLTSPEDKACEDKAQTQPPSLGKEVKKAAPGTPKMQRSGCSVSSTSSPKAIPKEQASKTSPKAGAKLAQSPLNGGPKQGHNGSSAPARSGSGSGLVRPRASSGSLRSSSQDCLSQSSDSLKSLAVDNMVRSHSFTHFKQIPSPTSQPMTRSFSFNRAVELAKPLANTQLRPPRSSFLKPPQLSNGRVGLGLGFGGLGSLAGGGLQYSRAPASNTTSLPSPSPYPVTTPTPTTPRTPSGLRKPLLPSCVLTKPSGGGGSLGYRLARPGQAKQQKPLFMGRVKGDVRPGMTGSGGIAIDVESAGGTERADSPTLTPEPPNDSGRSSGGGGGGLLQESFSQAAGEGMEDMSLSSASSLDRGDTSEEFLDDFDSLGDGLSDGDLPDNRKTGSSTQTRLRCFLNETMDWNGMGLAGGKEEVGVQGSRGPLALSPEGSDLQGSSLEISPSNSSGGTYMWDEEGLEPLGGPVMHPCDSYDDSEINSMDILNNLEPLGPGELDDDDLMLDVDLSEDGSLYHDTDGMAHFDHSERGGRQGHWRRRQHRWNGPDHVHNDNRAPALQHYDGFRGPGSFRVSPRPLPPVGKQDGHMGALDELTLKHMAQDCSSLKNQLLRLKSLLELEDGGCSIDAVEESEDNITALQLEELMREVRLLREELRSRDKSIAQLTLQCQQLQQQQQQQQEQRTGASATTREPPLDCEGTDRGIDGHSSSMTKPHKHTGEAPAMLVCCPPPCCPRGRHSTRAHPVPACCSADRPQILQPSSPCLSEHLHQERLVKILPTEDHSDPPRRSRRRGRAHTDSDPSSGSPIANVSGPTSTLAPDPDELSVLLSTHLHLHDHLGSGAPQGGSARGNPVSAAQSGTELERRAPTEIPRNSGTPGSVDSAQPRVLQAPRLHKHVSVPALPPGGTSGSVPLRGSPGLLANVRTKQLPPPSRGLPCFNTGPQAQAPCLSRPSLPLPRTALGLRRDPGATITTNPSLEEPDMGQLRTRVLVPPSLSRLPKPKI